MASTSPVNPRPFCYAGRPLASGAYDTGRLCNGMQWASPICVGLASAESATLQDDPNDISNLFQAIESVRLPVYIKIGLDPTSVRTTAALAVTNAQAQMSYYKNLFLTLGLTSLFGGFWWEWNTQNQFPSDGSRLTNTQLNTLILLAHNTYNVPVAVVSATPGDIFSPATGVFGRTYPNPTAVPNAVTILGAGGGYADWIILKNPFQDIMLSLAPAVPGSILTLDISRYMGMLSLASRIATSNLNVASVQALNLQPWLPLNAQYPTDLTAGIFLNPSIRDRIINYVNFSRFCGLAISFLADNQYGYLTNTILPNYLLRTSPKIPTYLAYGKLQVSNNEIVITQPAGNLASGNIGTFNSNTLALITLVGLT